MLRPPRLPYRPRSVHVGYLTGAFALLLKEMDVNGQVVGIERYKALSDRSVDNLRAAGLGDLLRTGTIEINCRSAFTYSSGREYDFIHVGAAATEVPVNLVRALRQGGEMLVYVIWTRLHGR